MIIATVVPRNYAAPWRFVQSLLSVTASYRFIFTEGPSVADNRNEILRVAKDADDHVLFIDADMVFNLADVQKAEFHLESGKDAIAGVYRLNQGEIALFSRTEGDYALLEPADGINPCAAAGTGFLGIHRKIVAIMPDNAFDQLWEGKVKHGTDVSFCHRMRERGCQLWYDSSIRLGHIRSTILYP